MRNEGQTYITRLTLAFLSFSQAPKNVKEYQIIGLESKPGAEKLKAVDLPHCL